MKEILRQAREVIQIEADAVQGLLDRLDESFVKAVETLLACKGRVVVTGIGKSGLVGRKIMATLISTGTPAMFLHPVEGLHGDLGMVTSQDILLAISNSGETAEIIHLLPSVKKIGARIIGLTGSRNSTLAKYSEVVLDVGVEREACPMGLAPTSSTTATLVMGDALAVALMRQRKFGEKDFALFHPGGSLGERLNTRVKDILRKVTEFPTISTETTVGEFLQFINRQKSDFALVLNPSGILAGLVMDRDLRRGDIGSPQFLARKVEGLMSSNLPAIDESTLIQEAMRAMVENHLVAIPVLGPEKRLMGVVTLQDCLHQEEERP
ncbi:MAG: KpsF/GutQ family sugar-phosphate isomerase [Deltaproteobacteria bacterium]|nr:KpsF/GutQ family sugar-phosphate isomerase [Deltaproteobacteria bacterium]